jgi:hypothetical protein
MINAWIFKIKNAFNRCMTRGCWRKRAFGWQFTSNPICHHHQLKIFDPPITKKKFKIRCLLNFHKWDRNLYPWTSSFTCRYCSLIKCKSDKEFNKRISL